MKCPTCGKQDCSCSKDSLDQTGPSVADSIPSSITAKTINEQNRRFWYQQAPLKENE